MNLMLENKVAVVTGASKGIGLTVTKMLVQEGAHVVAAALTTDSLSGMQGVTAVALDLTDPAAPGELVSRAVDDHGRVDVLVNNVGATRIRLDGFLAVDDEQFEWAMQMNFFTTLRASRATLATMVTQGSGAIVNVASVNAFYQPDGATIDYGAAKAAVANLTKSLAQEFGPQGYPRKCGLARAGQYRSLAGGGRCGADRGQEDRRRCRYGPQTDRGGDGRLRHRSFQHARRGGDARRGSRFRAHRECHRCQLRHRWRPHQDHMITSTTSWHSLTGARAVTSERAL